MCLIVRRLLWIGVIALSATAAWAEPSRFESILKDDSRELFLWRDVANVYVLRDGDAAVMIDIGDGSVLDHLGEIGVKRLEWVLLTSHHRQQCQGHPKLQPWKPQIAAPEKERALLERPHDFRKMRPSLGDAFTVYGASYVRPPVEPLKVDRGLAAMDTFTWRGCEFWCLETAGSSPGGISYLWKTKAGWIAFGGDVMLAGGRMYNWFDTEWDYGFAKGLYALIQSASLLESFQPVVLLPGHGPIIRQPQADFALYQEKLRRLARLLVRGYAIFTFADADQDTVSRPSIVPHLWQTTPHLFKLKGPNYAPNVTLLLADSGRALLVDCGLADHSQFETVLGQMRQRLGLKSIDAVLITHMHGDHALSASYLREKWGTKVWTLDRVAEKLDEPERFDYAAMIWSYDAKTGPVKVDRRFRAGEKFSWEGYEFTVDWMPGQTEFGCAIQGMIDGRRVVFTGDNLFANPADPQQDGHEAVVARNSAILEEGYILAARYLQQLQPDLIMGGHSYVMDRPKELIERYARWSLAMREAFRAVSDEEDYQFMFDPYWVRVDPYRVRLEAKPEGSDATLCLRNFLDRPVTYRLSFHAPAGITVAEELETTVAAQATSRVPLCVKRALDARPGISFVAIDVTRDGKRYGEYFDFIVEVPEK